MTMTELDTDRTAAAPRRRARRSRQLLVAGLTAALAWTGVSYLASTAGVEAQVNVTPGASADGSVADVVPLSDTVTISKGSSQQVAGVKIARVDVASAHQTDLAITMAWQNANEFSQKTGNRFWQIRLGLYYPVRTGTCGGSDPDHAVTVALTAAENWGGASGQSFCAYRDTAAAGPGVVTTNGHEDEGTQLMAADYLVSMLRPQTSAASPAACSGSGTSACTPAGLGADRRTYFVVAGLLNPGGNVPPGQVDDLMDVDMFVRASKVGG